MMARFRNKKVLQLLGARIQDLRLQKDLEIEDISDMTGISSNTIRNIEAGSEVSLTYFLEVCFALGLHPRKVLDIPLKVEPRFKLSASRKEKSRLTPRIRSYLEKGYFQEEKTAAEVAKEIFSEYKVKRSTSAVSVILNRFAKQNLLQTKSQNNKNFYKDPKKR